MFPLFSGTKLVFNGEGDRLALPSQQHLAPLQVDHTLFRIQVAARGLEEAMGAFFPQSLPQKPRLGAREDTRCLGWGSHPGLGGRTRLFTVCRQLELTCPHLTAPGTLGHSAALGPGCARKSERSLPIVCLCSPQTFNPNNSLVRVVYQRIWGGGGSEGSQRGLEGFQSESAPTPRDFSDPGFVREPDVFFPLDSTPHLHLPLPPYTVDFHPWPGGRATLVAVTRGPVFSAMQRGLRSRSSSSLLPGCGRPQAPPARPET